MGYEVCRRMRGRVRALCIAGPLASGPATLAPEQRSRSVSDPGCWRLSRGRLAGATSFCLLPPSGRSVSPGTQGLPRLCIMAFVYAGLGRRWNPPATASRGNAGSPCKAAQLPLAPREPVHGTPHDHPAAGYMIGRTAAADDWCLSLLSYSSKSSLSMSS